MNHSKMFHREFTKLGNVELAKQLEKAKEDVNLTPKLEAVINVASDRLRMPGFPPVGKSHWGYATENSFFHKIDPKSYSPDSTAACNISGAIFACNYLMDMDINTRNDFANSVTAVLLSHVWVETLEVASIILEVKKDFSDWRVILTLPGRKDSRLLQRIHVDKKGSTNYPITLDKSLSSVHEFLPPVWESNNVPLGVEVLSNGVVIHSMFDYDNMVTTHYRCHYFGTIISTEQKVQ